MIKFLRFTSEINQIEPKQSYNQKRRDLIIITSPIIVIILCHIVARISFYFLREWAWTTTAIFYWLIITLLTFLTTEKKNIKTWFIKSKKSIWVLILIIGGFSTFPVILLRNLDVLNIKNINLIIFCILYSIINGFIEELYWRGLIYDIKINLSRWIIIIYSSVLFALIHPLMLGVFSELNRTIFPLIIAFFIGIIYSMGFFKIESLRWLIYSHILADIGSLSIFVFMNLL